MTRDIDGIEMVRVEKDRSVTARNIYNMIHDLVGLNNIEVLKFSGNYTTGTYTVTYQPASGEKVFIKKIIFNTYAGRGELRLYWGTDIIAQCSVDATYYEMNAESECEITVTGDGTTTLTLEMVVNASTSYFAKAIARRIIIEEVI